MFSRASLELARIVRNARDAMREFATMFEKQSR
jgi:hypothetical protein